MFTLQGHGLIMNVMSCPRIMAAMLTLQCAAAPLLAQAQIGNAPEPGKAWLAGVISVVLICAVLVGSFKPSKRGHQD